MVREEDEKREDDGEEKIFCRIMEEKRQKQHIFEMDTAAQKARPVALFTCSEYDALYATTPIALQRAEPWNMPRETAAGIGFEGPGVATTSEEAPLDLAKRVSHRLPSLKAEHVLAKLHEHLITFDYISGGLCQENLMEEVACVIL